MSKPLTKDELLQQIFSRGCIYLDGSQKPFSVDEVMQAYSRLSGVQALEAFKSDLLEQIADPKTRELINEIDINKYLK